MSRFTSGLPEPIRISNFYQFLVGCSRVSLAQAYGLGSATYEQPHHLIYWSESDDFFWLWAPTGNTLLSSFPR
jgi:hypothetical protein